MDATASRTAQRRRAGRAVAARARRRLDALPDRWGPSGSVRSEAGARAAVVAVSFALSVGLAGVLRLALAVAG